MPHFIDVLDILSLHLLLFIPPEDAHHLGKVSKECRNTVMKYYKKYAVDHVLPGGEWHMNLCKRTRDSMLSAKQVSYVPLAIASLVQQKCGVCHKRFRAACHPTFGLLVHKDCVRPFLINTYYIRADYSLTESDFEDHVPLHTLKSNGWFNEYEYNVVWKDCKHGLVPYSWTSEYIINDLCKEQTARIRRQREEAERRRLEEEEKQEKKRKMARDKRMRQLLSLIDSEKVNKVVQSGLTATFCSRFFGHSDIRCPDTADKTAHIISLLFQLLEDGHSRDEIHARLRFVYDWTRFKGLQDILKSKEWNPQSNKSLICRGEGCSNNASRRCDKCAKCCDGCARHRSK